MASLHMSTANFEPFCLHNPLQFMISDCESCTPEFRLDSTEIAQYHFYHNYRESSGRSKSGQKTDSCRTLDVDSKSISVV